MQHHLDNQPNQIPPLHEPEGATWAAHEFGPAALPDERLRQRLILMATQFGNHPTASIPEACGDWADTKAAYRFFDNEAVESPALLAAHHQATRERIKPHPVVLVPQDTTAFTFSHHPQTQGLGPIGHQADGAQGLLRHQALALTEGGEALGVIFARFWARDPKDFHKAQKRYERTVAEKESSKWRAGWQATVALARQVPQTQFISLCDREGDVYELMQAAVETDCPNAGLLVRLQHNRKVKSAAVEESAERPWGKLDACLRSQPVAATLRIQVPRQEDRPARPAVLEVRFCAVRLHPPKRKPHLPALPVYAVEARETAPPKGEAAIGWQLLTTWPVTTASEAIRCVQWYAKRWQIEVFHKVLKSGCRVEQRQLESAERLQRMLGVYVVVAWRILALTIAAREHPELPVNIWLEEAEWQTLACWVNRALTPLKAPPTVNEAVLWIAKLGGFLARKGDGMPGPICLWRGLRRLRDLTAGFMLAKTLASSKRCG
jgi:hypothetical protein